MAEQFVNAPAPSREEFNTLNGKITNFGDYTQLATNSSGTSYPSVSLASAITNFRYLLFVYCGGTVFLPSALVSSSVNSVNVTAEVGNDVYKAWFTYVDATHFTITTDQGSQWYIFGIK